MGAQVQDVSKLREYTIKVKEKTKKRKDKGGGKGILSGKWRKLVYFTTDIQPRRQQGQPSSATQSPG